MKFVSSRDFRLQPSGIWDLLKQGEQVVVTMHGKPMGILIGTDENNFQKLSQELNLLKMRMAIHAINEHARKTGLDKLSEAEVDLLVKEAAATYEATLPNDNA